ncbi:hypothetical protein AGMMS49965_18230 [Bacteroidia bacterium]|nr:hypothetical protein AGMMS49965_18230 [Bacteroidia bacterium]
MQSQQRAIVPQSDVMDKNGVSEKLLAPSRVPLSGNQPVKSTLRAAASTDLGDGFYLLDAATDPTSTVVAYKVSNTQLPNLIKSGYGAEMQSISKSVYTKFQDDFDFLFFVLDTVNTPSIINTLGFYGINHQISNSVKGIGRIAYSNAAAWGSAGKLQSVMYFPMYNAISLGPSLHELAHNWAAYICPTFDVGGKRYDGHWGVSNAGGQLGGFKYVKKIEENSGGVTGKTKYQASMKSDFSGGFGENANGGNSLVYSDIELYLMGLKSAKELRDANFRLDVYTGNSYESSGNFSFGKGYFYSTGITSYTIDDLITLGGVREPDAATSQKKFKVLTVILSPAETPQHYADIVKAVSWFTGGMNDSYPGWSIYNFAQATGGVGSLEAAGIKNSLITPPTSIESLPAGSWRAADLQVHPNPVRDIVYFATETGNVAIYDLTGKQVFSKAFYFGQLDLSSLSPGVYVMSIQSGGEVRTAKLIKK